MKKSVSCCLLFAMLCMPLLGACGQTDTGTEIGSASESDEPESTAETEETAETFPPTIFLVGDSTVSPHNDKSHYYPRYGYGTQLENFVADGVKVDNKAISGRSSKSFKTEDNYYTIKSKMKPGDYLIIGFGHNDEKSEDENRFTDASKDSSDETSFGYHLYKYYIEMAREKGVIPILCTPIVRAAPDNDYSGSRGHITATGDYRQAILDLAAEYDVPVIDLTTITRERYEEIGYEEARLYHALNTAKYAKDGVTVVPDWSGVDKTHLNIYGAKYIAYRLACELKSIEGIGDWIADELTEPTEADLEPYPNFVMPEPETEA